MRILLISPRWAGFGNRKKVKVREREVHPLTLGIIAALSGDHEVHIIDEQVQRIPFQETWDLVGITCTTYVAPQAYQIAGVFRSRGVPVIMGGVHPTLMPEECLRHGDSVVRGEAETVWERVLHDAEKRNLAPVYEGGAVTDMSLIPPPRRDLFHRPGRSAEYVQATRGCGWTCNYCYLQYVGWGAHRKRPLDEVIKEIRSIDRRFVLMVDDNLFVDREYALDLFRAMIPLGKFWWAQAPTTICWDDELLQAAYQSGCFALSIGFQTINTASIEQARVTQNRVERYREAVRNLHRHRLLVDGTFIFGFDADPPTIFRDTAEAVLDLELDTYTFYMLTPYPGTPYFAQLEEEERIIDYNWAHYDWDHVVMQPQGMSAEELATGVAWAYNTLDTSRFNWMKRHVARNAWVLGRSPRLAAFLLRQNLPQPYRVDY
jgi:radical SAM superfamily enzyme YgiQ (UPF0313 family)